ncbi:LOW QUALITY PROTEIN: hypothetical protein TorRG33x02_088590 [Trema orientale]|uniref:Uncharacterized protein n=1 Tax=Trema orientale TaxID=63057 RepID=A0A2P5FC02_TREOI|nr:LOW QUALITY PROTEIN: hypothetical protein TorRG33x02_088590 [Trema orientale]
MPTASAILVHLISKPIIVFLDESVNVKPVEESRSVIHIHPVNNGLTLAEYLNIRVSVDEVVQENSVRSDYGLIIRATLLQADEVSEHGFRRLLNEQSWNHHDTGFLAELNVQDGIGMKVHLERDSGVLEICS